MRSRETILKDYQLGNRLSDEELETLLCEMEGAALLLREYGDTFAMAVQYAERVSKNCDIIINDRAETAAFFGDEA